MTWLIRKLGYAIILTGQKYSWPSESYDPKTKKDLVSSNYWCTCFSEAKTLLIAPLMIIVSFRVSNKPAHDKTNKMTCAPSEASDQRWHPPSLIGLRSRHEDSLGP